MTNRPTRWAEDALKPNGQNESVMKVTLSGLLAGQTAAALTAFHKQMVFLYNMVLVSEHFPNQTLRLTATDPFCSVWINAASSGDA